MYTFFMVAILLSVSICVLSTFYLVLFCSVLLCVSIKCAEPDVNRKWWALNILSIVRISFFNLRETAYVNLTEIWHNFHMIHLTLIFVKGIFLSCCSVTSTALDSVLFDKKGSMLLTTFVPLQLPLLLFWTSQNDARIPFHQSQCYLIGR